MHQKSRIWGWGTYGAIGTTWGALIQRRGQEIKEALLDGTISITFMVHFFRVGKDGCIGGIHTITDPYYWFLSE
jgi:hypothetical protein